MRRSVVVTLVILGAGGGIAAGMLAARDCTDPNTGLSVNCSSGSHSGSTSGGSSSGSRNFAAAGGAAVGAAVATAARGGFGSSGASHSSSGG